MPVSGEPGLIPKLTGGSGKLLERENDPVGSCRTARPGPSLIRRPSAPKPGPLGPTDRVPAIALADTWACQAGRPGRILKQRTAMSGLRANCHLVTLPTNAAIRGHGDFPSRSGQEILT